MYFIIINIIIIIILEIIKMDDLLIVASVIR